MPETAEPELYAALDLGSNSFHLLVATFSGEKLRIVDRHKELIRLAAGLDENGLLTEQVQQQAMECLARIADRLRHISRDHIRVVGTNALRMAHSTTGFLRRAEAVLGAPINIISGTEEARLTWLGVASDHAPSAEGRLVIDIGGSSTELVVGYAQPARLESLSMGCVTWTQRFFRSGKLDKKTMKTAVTAARREVAAGLPGFDSDWSEVVGASGTIRSVGEILDANGWGQEHLVTAEGLKALSGALLAFDRIDDVRIPGLSDNRRDVLPGGLAILVALFEELDLKAMHVSSYAIREGLIHELAGRLHHHDRREETVAHMMAQYHVNSSKAGLISATAAHWLPTVRKHIVTDYDEAMRLLNWASRLYGIGLAIAHGGYHKHGHYILSNADMPGFSRQEQRRLSFLVLNHRRKPRDLPEEYGFTPDWYLVALFRLAMIFNRRRHTTPIGDVIGMQVVKKQIVLVMPESWLDANPLTLADLEQEQQALESVGLVLRWEVG